MISAFIGFVSLITAVGEVVETPAYPLPEGGVILLWQRLAGEPFGV